MPPRFGLSEGKTYALCAAAIVAASMGMYAFGNKEPGRNIFDVAP